MEHNIKPESYYRADVWKDSYCSLGLFKSNREDANICEIPKLYEDDDHDLMEVFIHDS